MRSTPAACDTPPIEKEASIRLVTLLIVLTGIVACRPGDLLRDATDEHGMTELMRAAAAGDATEVRRLAEAGARLNQRVRARPIRELFAALMFFQEQPGRSSGYSAVQFAISGGHLDATRALLDAGVSVEDRDDEAGMYPVQLAVRAGPQAVPLVRLLLERGAWPNPPADRTGNSALHLAAGVADSEVVALLLEAGAPPDVVNRDGETALVWAAREGRIDVAALLLDAGADPEIRGGRQRWTALSWAEESSHGEVVELLRSRGASEATEANRRLAEAVRRGEVEDTRAALAAGADPNASALFGGPILLDAIRTGPPDVARLLLEAGARQPRDPLRQSGLRLALSQSRLEVADVLLEFGADSIESGLVTGAAAAGSTGWVARLVDAGNDPKEGEGAPLRAAARNGAPEVVTQLLELEVDPDAADEHGRTPLGQAVAFGHVEVVRLLLEAGARVDGLPGQWSPLMSATQAGHVPLVRLLLDHGADPQPRTPEGRSLSELAAQSGNPEVEALVAAALR